MKNIGNIGITGGIGSGKTYVCNLLEEKGIRIYNADIRAKYLLENNAEIRSKVIHLLGSGAYLTDGKPDRSFIASKVFQDNTLLHALNAIIHPATLSDYEIWKTQVPADYTWNFQLKEAAILFESGSHKGLDAVICVYAPKEIRLKRVMERDQLHESEVLARMDKQISDQEKINQSDYILVNDGQMNISTQIDTLCNQLQSRFAD